MKTATSQARVVLAAMTLAALLVLAWTLAAPANAQEEAASEDKDASDKSEQSLQDAAVTTRSNAADTVTRIEIAADGCDVEKGAIVTVRNGTNETTFVNGDTRNTDDVIANIQSTSDQIVIDNFKAGLGESVTEDSKVIDSSGTDCGSGQRADDDTNKANIDDLATLNCDDLLVLFRGGGGGQYGNVSDFADSEVRARVEVCLKKEIVQGTAADEDLPDTGGLSLLGLAVLGVVSAAAGLAVIRGGRR